MSSRGSSRDAQEAPERSEGTRPMRVAVLFLFAHLGPRPRRPFGDEQHVPAEAVLAAGMQGDRPRDAPDRDHDVLFLLPGPRDRERRDRFGAAVCEPVEHLREALLAETAHRDPLRERPRESSPSGDDEARVLDEHRRPEGARRDYGLRPSHLREVERLDLGDVERLRRYGAAEKRRRLARLARVRRHKRQPEERVRGVRVVPHAGGRTGAPLSARTTRKALRAFVRPFRRFSPRGWKTNASPARRAVSSPTTISSGPATELSRRPATFTVFPRTV